MNTQLKKGALELCVLSILGFRDCYGYELASLISKNIQVSDGTIYPLLKRLKDDGNVTTYISEESDGPPRKYYQVTDQGKKVTLELKSEWVDFTKAVNQILEGEISE